MRRPLPGDTWHLDEGFIKINGVQKYLWRAVDQDGNVLDILVTSRRDTAAARRFFRKLLKTTETVPRVIVTDKLRCYGAAHRTMMPSVEHRQSRYLNNRYENSQQPTRQRERAMWKFISTGHAQRFLSAFSGISPHFRPRRHLLTAHEYRTEMRHRSPPGSRPSAASRRPPDSGTTGPATPQHTSTTRSPPQVDSALWIARRWPGRFLGRRQIRPGQSGCATGEPGEEAERDRRPWWRAGPAWTALRLGPPRRGGVAQCVGAAVHLAHAEVVRVPVVDVGRLEACLVVHRGHGIGEDVAAADDRAPLLGRQVARRAEQDAIDGARYVRAVRPGGSLAGAVAAAVLLVVGAAQLVELAAGRGPCGAACGCR